MAGQFAGVARVGVDCPVGGVVADAGSLALVTQPDGDGGGVVAACLAGSCYWLRFSTVPGLMSDLS